MGGYFVPRSEATLGFALARSSYVDDGFILAENFHHVHRAIRRRDAGDITILREEFDELKGVSEPTWKKEAALMGKFELARV